MQWVDEAKTRPMRCAVVPYIGNGSGHAFLDTGQDLDLEHVYISDVGCELLARELGWVRPQELAEANERIASLTEQVQSLREQLLEADLFEQAIDGLTKKGMVIRKQPGRKPKKQEVEA